MIFGKKDHLVGLDIGSKTIKVCEIAETKNEIILKKFGSIDINPHAIQKGIVKDADHVANSIRELFKLYNINKKNVAISIGGYSVIVKTINVQTMPEEQLQETIGFEAEQYIPFDISDVNLDFQILGEHEQNPNQMNVLLVAAKKEMIADYMKIVNMAGLNLCVIDVDAFALQNVYELNYDIKDECIALIDIGVSKTTLNILRGNSSLFIRHVSLGCAQINQKIVSRADCSFEEAEELKCGDKPDKLSLIELKEIISSVVADWCAEIKRAYDFFNSTNPHDRIEKILLSGGGANIVEFQHLLSNQTSADVKIVNPFGKFHIDYNRLDADYLKQMAPQAAICMGLGIRKVDDK
ncbi:MAG: type IV pilus assembly protein PilM [Deltaproteobacteria bacterium]|nr:type IV pilus assembly protein PilM [Deltaproteobacteria bacterium]